MKTEIRYMKIFSSFPASLLASSRSPSLYTPPARFPRPPCSSHALFLPSSHYSCFSCPFRRDYLRYMKTDLRYMKISVGTPAVRFLNIFIYLIRYMKSLKNNSGQGGCGGAPGAAPGFWYNPGGVLDP